MSLDQPVVGGSGGARHRIALPIPVGTQFDVPVYVNVANGQVNAVRSDVSYPTSLMSLVSSTPNTSAWNTTAVNANSSGTIDVQVGATTPQTGSVLLTTLTFQAVAPGTANLSFTASTQAADASQAVGTVTATQGATYTFN